MGDVVVWAEVCLLEIQGFPCLSIQVETAHRGIEVTVSLGTESSTSQHGSAREAIGFIRSTLHAARNNLGAALG